MTIPSARNGYVRGDANDDEKVNIADPVAILNYLSASMSLVCPASADGNGDGRIDIADPIFILEFLFQKGPTPLPPFPECGWDPRGEVLPCG